MGSEHKSCLSSGGKSIQNKTKQKNTSLMKGLEESGPISQIWILSSMQIPQEFIRMAESREEYQAIPHGGVHQYKTEGHMCVKESNNSINF